MPDMGKNLNFLRNFPFSVGVKMCFLVENRANIIGRRIRTSIHQKFYKSKIFVCELYTSITSSSFWILVCIYFCLHSGRIFSAKKKKRSNFFQPFSTIFNHFQPSLGWLRPKSGSRMVQSWKIVFCFNSTRRTEGGQN